MNRKKISLPNKPNYKSLTKQECIPVGCVPSATVTVCLGGLFWLGGGVFVQGCVCLARGCLPGGVSARRVCVCVCRGCVCPGGVSARRGVHLPSVDRILGTRLEKHYLSTTSFVDGNKPNYKSLKELKHKLHKLRPKVSKRYHTITHHY